jgi:isoleucyl-tRNA synthetase
VRLLFGQQLHGLYQANKALAYNEALDYVLIQLNDDGDFKNRKIVIAEALLDSVIKECFYKRL